MSDDGRMRKLQWLCRRGMKELDVLLESFLEREQRALRLGAWPELEALLAEEDDRIWDWLLHPDTSEVYGPLIHAILRRA